MDNSEYGARKPDLTKRADPRELLEVSDLVVAIDPDTLERLPVRRSQLLERCHSTGHRRAAQIIGRLPHKDDWLDNDSVDRLLIRVHCEIQRLSEEFQHGQRIYELLRALTTALQSNGVSPPYRCVDVGCGTGYVIRWLAAHRPLPDWELVGVDFNRALVEEAQRLAQRERFPCRLEAGNAFRMKRPGTLYMSTGVLHHFRGTEALAEFFRQHDQPPTWGFAHFDFQPTILSWPGSWLFHFIRMHEPLSRHDGVMSARRAHTAETLLKAARGTAFRCAFYSRTLGPLRLPRVFQTLIGVRPELEDAFRQALGKRAARLEAFR